MELKYSEAPRSPPRAFTKGAAFSIELTSVGSDPRNIAIILTLSTSSQPIQASMSLQQKEIDRVLHLRRISQARSCYPCRQRKVKCDHGQPCQTCRKRGHPEICSYNVGTPEKKRGRRAKAAAAAAVSTASHRGAVQRGGSEPEPESEPEAGLEPPRRNDDAGAHGHESEPSLAHTPSSLATTQTSNSILFTRSADTTAASCHPPRKELYQGGSSVLTMLHGSTDSPAVEMRRKAGPVLGLHNTLEFYPFMKLKTWQERWVALLKLIPQKQEVLRYGHDAFSQVHRCRIVLHTWRHLADHCTLAVRYFPSHGATIYPLNPVMLDPDGLESAFCEYLTALEAGELRSPDVPSSKWVCKAYISRIALLLAALATSAHYSVMQSPKKRSEHCLDFVQRAFDALRLANYVLHPSLDGIQTLLIIGTVLQDVGQSDGAWVMMGTTVRAAQALGLHTQSASQQSDDGAKKKQALWDAICRQDGLLSLCHGRPHIASKQSFATENTLKHSNRPLDFSEMMCGIVKTSSSLLELEQLSCEASMKLLAELDGYRSRAAPYLRCREKCTNIQQRYESLTIESHLSFAVSIMCRPALSKSALTENEPDVVRALRAQAKDSLMSTAKAFIDFQAVSIIPIRTWSLIHAVLSATIVLCLWEETRRDQESRDVLQRVMEIFSRAAQADDETGMMVDASGNSNWLSMNHIRALVALQNAIQTDPALHACGGSSSPERQEADDVVQQNYSLPRGQNTAPIDPMMEAGMGYNFTTMLGQSWPMDEYMYPWDTSGLSPLMYLDSIMKAPYEAVDEF
ncbi:transcriptional regulator family: Fungal Specific TF [Trichoderma aggressivum f. europaeum]|uniref:Transcriptional regulator family: Fungal Specific TF n=1 Tax=Trichoderma aggressivum f. europaeum TaxID=173218 RepID=A0AAE1I8Q2_9HYPO|nr:transcriptional regulator family: Fungal Specific TF [Trichoderma aggressivum f. europaeum]